MTGSSHGKDGKLIALLLVALMSLSVIPIMSSSAEDIGDPMHLQAQDIAATFDSLTPEDQEKLMKVASIMETKEEVEKRKQESNELENDKNVVISISTQPMKGSESSLPVTEEQKDKTLSILKVDEPKTNDEKESDESNDTNEKDGVGGTKKISFDL